MRHVFTTPGIAACIDDAIARGVDQLVKMFSPKVKFVRTAYSLSFFTLLLSQVNSSSAHKKIKAAHAIPIAKPKMLRKL